MKIEKLRLKGFIGIKRGLGLEEINIDFGNIGGLVAFAGQNGLGKSTILENMHPFNTLASRSGAIFNHVGRRDSEKDLSFVYNGDHYHTLLKIDCQSGKSEGFIWKNGESMVNGKISAYAKYITELFGSQNLFFNSVFCSQNATKLSDMTTGKLKELFSEFLRLGKLQEHEETCKQKINVLSGKAAQIDTTLEVLRKRMDGTQGIKEEIARLNVLKEEKERLKTDLNAKLLGAQKEREGLKEIIARNEVLREQVTAMKASLIDMQDNQQKEEAANSVKLTGLRKQYSDLSREIADADKVLASESAIYAAIENERALKELIENITRFLDDATHQLVEDSSAVTGLEKEIQELKSKVVLPEKDAEHQDLKFSLMSLNQQIKSCENNLLTLDARDPDCTSKSCSFIVAALDAEKELPGLKEKYQQTDALMARRSVGLMNNAAEIGRMVEGKKTELDAAKFLLDRQQTIQKLKRKELAEKRLELSRYQNLTAQQSEIAVAKSKKEDREKALEENKKQGMAIAEEWKARAAALDVQIAKQQENIKEITENINKKASDTLDVLNYQVESTIKQIVEIDPVIGEIGNRIAAKQNDLSGITEAESQFKTTEENKATVQADIADWTYIRNACGKNGIQALEIDATAPLISSFANDLLSKAFGPLFSVKLLTQNADGKEVLDIVVISDDGEEILLDNLSGGQKIWVLMALRLAMTLLSKEKSGKNFQSFFADEIDGPLDSENANNFIKMYQAFMQIGGFKSGYFISHKESCRDLADNILMFEPGKNPYWS